MQITVKLYATLGKYLPAGAHKNQISMTVDDGATVVDVIRSLKVPEENCHLVLVDGVYIAPEERDTRALEEGEALAVWPPVAGG